jgi:uncharacterized damage-inducible protein DinB
LDLLEHLRRQLSYDAWANAEVLAAIKASEDKSDLAQPLKLLAHVLSAERLWLERLGGEAQSLPVWPEFSMEQCAANIAELSELWDKYFVQLSSTGLSEPVRYKNSKGESWTSSVLDVLTHIVMHSAYHRGQIASVMRAGGDTPAYTDFIHAARQGLIESF